MWEIAIKKSMGKISISSGYLEEMKKEGFIELPISWKHAEFTASLPKIHNDPFDRLLVAQAKIEAYILLSIDEEIRKFGIEVM